MRLSSAPYHRLFQCLAGVPACRNGLNSGLERRVPQGLKPAFFHALNGSAEAVPYPKPIYETSSIWS
jgi:hypothetical protein